MYETDAVYTRNASNQSWKKRSNISMGALLPQNDTQILWFCPPGHTEPVDVHAVKEAALSALPGYFRQDYTLAVAPFEFGGNKYAVIQDASGRRICLVERAAAPQMLS